MDTSPSPEITRLLQDWREGSQEALDLLVSRVYEELRAVAAAQLASERPDHTLQATGLVHEAYVRLVDAKIPWEDRAHFFAVASGTMRRVLVDHARARRAQKRGGERVGVTLHDDILADGSPADEILALDEALSRLASVDPRKGRTVELRYFGGLNATEIGEVLGVAVATVQRDLRMARAWLMRELSDGSAPDTTAGDP